MKSAFLGGAAVLLAVAPAVAGPAGSGLAHTEAVARQAAQRTITVAQSDPACARQAAERIRTQDGVAWTKARPGKVLVAFRSDEHAARGAAEARAVVAENCRAA
ncbi:hypothetical protein [Caulobacter sp. LARHSG274]